MALLARLLRQLRAHRKPVPGASESRLWTIGPQTEDGYAAIVNSSQGLFIINAFDEGVGWQLRTFGACDPSQMELLARVAAASVGSVALDVGANIGVTSLILARNFASRAEVHAFEPQQPIFHMLAGNMALNGVDNVTCHHMALGAAPGEALLPLLDYRSSASFGSVELNRVQQSDALQQAVDGQFRQVPMASIDSLGLSRVALIKIDVEGMEAEVLAGGRATIQRDRPLLYVEHLKSDKHALARMLVEAGYSLFDAFDNFVCIPADSAALSGLSHGLVPFLHETGSTPPP